MVHCVPVKHSATAQATLESTKTLSDVELMGIFNTKIHFTVNWQWHMAFALTLKSQHILFTFTLN